MGKAQRKSGQTKRKQKRKKKLKIYTLEKQYDLRILIFEIKLLYLGSACFDKKKYFFFLKCV